MIRNTLLLLSLSLILFQCSPPGTAITTTLKIQSDPPPGSEQTVQLTDQLMARLEEHGAKAYQVQAGVDGKIIVNARVNLESDQALKRYHQLFQSTRMGFWHTYRITDLEAAVLDSLRVSADCFQLHHQEATGMYPVEVLGVCNDSSQLEKIANELHGQLRDLPNLKLTWSSQRHSMMDGQDSYYELYLLDTKDKQYAPFTEQDLSMIESIKDKYSGQYAISLKTNNLGARVWAEMTTTAAQDGNRAIAIVINDRVYSAPRVMNPILTGDSMISGDFTEAETRALANALSMGALPFELEIIAEEIKPAP